MAETGSAAPVQHFDVLPLGANSWPYETRTATVREYIRIGCELPHYAARFLADDHHGQTGKVTAVSSSEVAHRRCW
ncbi:MAG TPA: hypothetical protein VFA63_00195, partial [Pseudonocardiaceae bacterium]|nr:hypothetical protein [Pseudonocardiaceae bacterium]